MKDLFILRIIVNLVMVWAIIWLSQYKCATAVASIASTSIPNESEYIAMGATLPLVALLPKHYISCE